jgi:hypothetical protein
MHRSAQQLINDSSVCLITGRTYQHRCQESFNTAFLNLSYTRYRLGQQVCCVSPGIRDKVSVKQEMNKCKELTFKWLNELMMNIANSVEQSPSWEVIANQLVKNFPVFNETRRFITAFTTACYLSLSWARSIQSTPLSYFLKVHFNIILPPSPKSSKLRLCFRLPHQNPLCTSPICQTCHILSTNSFFLILSPEKYLVSSYDQKVYHAVFSTPVTSCLLQPNRPIFLSTLLSKPSAYLMVNTCDVKTARKWLFRDPLRIAWRLKFWSRTVRRETLL